MIERISRLSRRAADVYQETHSPGAALRYLGRTVAAKASLALRHLVELRRVMIPWQAAAQARRVDQLREGGRVAIAVTVSGGLGDLIVMARFLRDLQASTEPFAFDVFASEPGIVRWAFRDVPGFADAYHDTLKDIASRAYDLRLTINQAVIVHYEFTRWNELRDAPRLAAAVSQISKTRRRGLEPYVLNHPRLDNGLARRAVYWNRTRRDFLHHMAGIVYGGDQLEIASDPAAVARFGLAGRRYVTIHNGFDTNFVVSGQRATKCYPHFAQVVAGLKAARPELCIVQIGTTTSEPIPGVDIDLLNRTSLREAAGLLRGAALHIDNEGGLVHLAAAYGVRSVVIFGPTPSDYFGYPENINIDPLKCGGCWWIDELWMDRCPKGLAKPECTYSQPPEAIVTRAAAALEPPKTVRLPQRLSA
jgi:hypothetical protein